MISSRKIKTNPFSIRFDFESGLSDSEKTTCRHLSEMRDMYANKAAYEKSVEEGDKLVYEFYELKLQNTSENLLFGTSILYPGKVGNEYFMTKGHFHAILDTAEVYYCLSGNGRMLMENPEGEWDIKDLARGRAVYVPGRYAHRSINIGNEPLVTFFVFRADAGHDYGTIETKGFRKLVIENSGNVEIVDNPNWK